MQRKEISNHLELIELKREMISEWIEKFSSEQKVDEISSDVVREVLESYGANFENLTNEVKESLSKYSEKDRGFGVRRVWGDQFVDDYKKSVNGYIKEYEAKTGIELPQLVNKKNPNESTKRKNSGMVQFLFDLTSFASGRYTYETFKNITEGRIKNGQAWAEGRKEDRIKISVPSLDKPILLSSIPPEFPIKAWKWILTKK